jgi:hypothetical protein
MAFVIHKKSIKAKAAMRNFIFRQELPLPWKQLDKVIVNLITARFFILESRMTKMYNC